MPVLFSLSQALPHLFSERFGPGDKRLIFSELPQSAASASEISTAKNPKTGPEPGAAMEQYRRCDGAKIGLKLRQGPEKIA
jgi:hypothetical protein